MQKGDDVVVQLTGHDDSPTRRSTLNGLARDRVRLSPWVWLFIIGLVIPLFVYIGPLRLSAYRLILIIAFFPAFFFWISGRAGVIRVPDICVLGICLWSTLSFSVVHGFGEMIETIGILWIETLGAYLVGRCYIRTPEAFYATVRILFWLGILILPFAIYEAVTGRNMILTIFGKIGSTYGLTNMEPRLGFERVQGPFTHPIHFGVFFLSLSGVVYYVLGYGRRWASRVGRMMMIACLGAMSLSSGPLVSLMAQLNIIIWDGVMKSVRQRWHIFAGLSVLGFLVIDMISNRTPFHVLIEYLALNKETAYNRIRIWQFGTDNIFTNPLFGLGFNAWEKPYWMSDSIDMFWILGAVRHGIPVWILWLVLFFSIFLAVAYRRNLSERVNWYRIGYLVTMFGLFMAGWTVHYWEMTYVFFMFMLASGVWLLDWQNNEDDGETTEATKMPSTYTRFPKNRATSAPITDALPVNGVPSRSTAGGSPQTAPMFLCPSVVQRARP